MDRETRQRDRLDERPYGGEVRDVIEGAYEELSSYPGIEARELGQMLATLYLATDNVERSLHETEEPKRKRKK